MIQSMGRRVGGRLAIAATAAAVAGGCVGPAAPAAQRGLAPASRPTASASHRLPPGIRAYAARRQGRVAVAVAARGGRWYGYRARQRQRTASIVKVEILEALLHRRHGPLSARRAAQARGMIERSDNHDAQLLWRSLRGRNGLRAFGRRASLTATAPAAGTGPGYAWGLTLTTPRDQLRLLGLIAGSNRLLGAADRRRARRLMGHVEADQRWGVTAGAGRSRVLVKNGWLPLRDGTTDWQVNSIGYVDPRHHRGYLIAVMTTGSPTMSYGVHTVAGVARRVARWLSAAGRERE